LKSLSGGLPDRFVRIVEEGKKLLEEAFSFVGIRELGGEFPEGLDGKAADGGFRILKGGFESRDEVKPFLGKGSLGGLLAGQREVSDNVRVHLFP